MSNNKIRVPNMIEAIKEAVATFNFSMREYRKEDTTLLVEVVHNKAEDTVSIVLSVTEQKVTKEISRFTTPKVKHGKVQKPETYIPLLYKQLMIALLEMSYVYSKAMTLHEQETKAQQDEHSGTGSKTEENTATD